MFPTPFICPQCRASLEPPVAGQLRCTGCGLQYEIRGDVPVLIARYAVHPPAAANSAPGTFDYLEHYRRDTEAFDYFEERTGATEDSERRLREFILSRIPSTVQAVLDVGCGSAWVAKAYQHKGVAICSLDASPVNPQEALRRFPSPRHKGVAADAYALPFPDASLECIVASEIIEHVPDPGRFLTELFRVLRPGGMIAVSTPYKEKIVYELCIHCGQQTPRNAHLHTFEENKLADYIPAREGATFEWWAFNNKALLHARSYIVLQFLPFALWRAIDRLANLMLNRPANIVAVYRKQA